MIERTGARRACCAARPSSPMTGNVDGGLEGRMGTRTTRSAARRCAAARRAAPFALDVPPVLNHTTRLVVEMSASRERVSLCARGYEAASSKQPANSSDAGFSPSRRGAGAERRKDSWRFGRLHGANFIGFRRSAESGVKRTPWHSILERRQNTLEQMHMRHAPRESFIARGA